MPLRSGGSCADAHDAEIRETAIAANKTRSFIWLSVWDEGSAS